MYVHVHTHRISAGLHIVSTCELSLDTLGSERDILEELLKETRISADVQVCTCMYTGPNTHNTTL